MKSTYAPDGQHIKKNMILLRKYLVNLSAAKYLVLPNY